MKLLSYFIKLMAFLLPISFIFTLGLVLYGLTIRGMPGKPNLTQVKDVLDQPTYPFELSPERGRYATLVALAEDQTIALREDLGLFAYPDVGYLNGKFYSYFAPGISVLALPLYILGLLYNIPQVAAYSTIAIFAILNLLTIYFICRSVLKLPTWAALAAAIIYGFGTTSWSYAITLYQHQVTTFLMLSSFLAVWKIRQKSKVSFLYASYVWIAYAFSIFIDYPNAILLLPIMIYFALSAFELHKLNPSKYRFGIRPSLIFTSIFFFLLIAAHGYINKTYYGDWKRLSGSLPSYKKIVEKKLTQADSTTQKAAEKDKNIVKFFSEEKMPNGFYTLLLSQDRGLLIYMPIMFIGIFGLLWAARHYTLENVILVSSVIINLFLYSSWGDPWGGWAYGPRYLIPSMALLSIFAALWLVKGYMPWIFRILSIPLFILSSGVALLGAMTTNAVPPKIEANFLKMNYNYLRSLEFFNINRTGSYIINTYLIQHYNLNQIYGIVIGLLGVIMVLLLLLVPLVTRESYDH